MSRLTRAPIILAALLSSTAVSASGAQWKVSEASGQVSVVRDGASVMIRRDAQLRPGDVVRTGPSSRAVLVRGQEYVIVSAGSHLQIKQATQDNPVTQIIQYLGNALFKIEKKSTPHFGVDTPYMAAVVKGTTFNVSVTSAGATVQVTEGAVEVATNDNLKSALLTPGLVGHVDSRDIADLLVVVGEEIDTAAVVTNGAPKVLRRLPAQAAASGNKFDGPRGRPFVDDKKLREDGENEVSRGYGKALGHAENNGKEKGEDKGRDEDKAKSPDGAEPDVGRADPVQDEGDEPDQDDGKSRGKGKGADKGQDKGKGGDDEAADDQSADDGSDEEGTDEEDEGGDTSTAEDDADGFAYDDDLELDEVEDDDGDAVEPGDDEADLV